MLRKQYRLTKKGSFAYVYRKGQSKGGQALVLVYIRSKGNPKAGFSVSNKLGKAVVRNQVKRRLRSAFGIFLQDVEPSQLVFIAKPPILLISYPEMVALMQKLLSGAGLLKTQAHMPGGNQH